MKQTKLLSTLLLSAILCTTPAVAQTNPDKGGWRAASKTAKSVTGDIAFLNDKIAINFATFPMADIRTLTPAEVSAVFDADASAGVAGELYRLSIPGNKKFLHSSTLCGAEDTQWIATYVTGKTLQLAFFSGSSMPVFTLDAISNSTSVCGLYTYQR